jgi:hypothetical protein
LGLDSYNFAYVLWINYFSAKKSWCDFVKKKKLQKITNYQKLIGLSELMKKIINKLQLWAIRRPKTWRVSCC